MRSRKDYIHYNKAVELYLKRDLSKVKAILKSAHLVQCEKNLIQARLLNLDGDIAQAIDLLKRTNTQSTYLEAQKYNVLSSLYDKSSMYQLAAISNHQALTNYEKLNDLAGIFISSLNLSINYSRLSLKSLHSHYLEIASNASTSFSNEIAIARVKASYQSKEGDYKAAIQTIENILSKSEFEDLANKPVLLNLYADILFRAKEFCKSSAIYKNLYSRTKSITRERIAYEHNVLSSLVKKKPLKNIPDFMTVDSEYYLLWQTLLFLQDGDPQFAVLSWDKLVELNPDRYLQNFGHSDIGDSNNHFFQYYAYLKSKNEGLMINRAKKNSMPYKLIQILNNSDIPLRKEVLIEEIWGIKYDPTYDTRFYKLIERTKKSTSLNISMSNSTYNIC